MKKENILFAAAITTTLLIRGIILILTILHLESHLMFKGYIVHHFWLGFILLLVSLLISRKHANSRIILAGAGLGILADELIFMLLGGGGYAMYWKPLSVTGAIICLSVLYILRKKIIFPILKEFK